MSKVIVVSPHPDDETLGCGGTLLKHKSNNDQIYWLIMTNIFESQSYDAEKVKQRQIEIEAVSNAYGFDGVFKLDYPTIKLDTFPVFQLVESVSDVFRKVKPDIVFLPNRSDVHSDHKLTFEVVISSTKTFRAPFVKKLLMYEVISETEFTASLQNNSFLPNSFCDIAEYFEKKIEIMEIYESEMGKHPFPRSKENLKALAIFRGATAGTRYAESFMLLKEIW